MKYVHQPVKKIDADSLLSGMPAYTDDLAPKECLTVKLVRSPHAFARIKRIHTENALRIPGVACVLTYQDFNGPRFTAAGQSYPEPSPYDRLILDQYVRYVGDVAAIVAADTEKEAIRAARLIKIEYEVLDPVLDYRQAIGHPSVIHPEADYKLNFDIGNDVKQNICASGSWEQGDLEAAFAACAEIVEETYETKANQQAMMETYRAYSYWDTRGKLTIVSSTQVPFHVRRNVAKALQLPASKVRVMKPRIGGGFGAKQTMVCELYPAAVTWKTGKTAKIFYSRREAFMGGNSRHAMQIKVKIGADKAGNLKAMYIDALSNTGAYGEHGSTTVGLVGSKTMSLYNRCDAYRFNYQVVYTNTTPAAAFRGYGATQGCFAVESALNQLAAKLKIDPVELRLKNIVRAGEAMHASGEEPLQSTALADCIQKGQEMIGWRQKYPAREVAPGIIRSVGMAVTMQGSGIANIDTASVDLRLGDDAFYNLLIGATDMGTGCDTIYSQMAAEILECPMEQISVGGVDTDFSPYDPGTYASSGTYVTGMAVVDAAKQLRPKICEAGAKLLQLPVAQVTFDGQQVFALRDEKQSVTLETIATESVLGTGQALGVLATFGSPTSPPPFMAGFAEIELDTATGQIKLLDYVGVVDCGTIINTNLARVQTEGGITQGIGMALYEDVQYSPSGKMLTNNFLQYKIPSRLDIEKIRVAFAESYEPTGPFGAKSIGEVVINTPAPAIAHAVYNACGVNIRQLPITGEKILQAMGKLPDRV